MLRKPQFIVIGTAQSGARAVHHQLAHQPGFYLPEPRVRSWFDKVDSAATAELASRFEGAPADVLCGELITFSMQDVGQLQGIERTKAALPELKLIYVMTEPLSRLTSQFLEERAEQRAPKDMELALGELRWMIEDGEYSQHLAPLLTAYGASNVLPVFVESLVSRGQAELERIARFLGHTGAVQWREEAAQQASFFAAVQATQRRSKEHTELSPVVRQRLVARFDRDLARLGSWLGITLTCENFTAVAAQTAPAWTDAVQSGSWKVTPRTGDGRRVAIVSPVRDEARTLMVTARCLEQQTLAPAQWVIVDDGSKDETPALLAQLAAKLPWVKVVTRGDRGYRKLGGGVIEAFDFGKQAIDVDYDFIAKMDVDLEFGPSYLEDILEHFAADPALAAASGKVFRREGAGLVEEFMIDAMVAGQFKLYRRESFERIGGFVREVMWDGIDFHRCRMEGFRTASLKQASLQIIHLRLMGSSDANVFKGRLRWGRGQWFMGSALPYVTASGALRSVEKPYVVGGLLIVAGYLQAALQRQPRYADKAFRANLRRWQYARLRGLLTGKGVR